MNFKKISTISSKYPPYIVKQAKYEKTLSSLCAICRVKTAIFNMCGSCGQSSSSLCAGCFWRHHNCRRVKLC